MTIIKIAYSKTYPITHLGSWEKILLEAQLIAGEDVRQSLYDLKKQVENFHYESNKAAEKQIGTTIKDVPEQPTLTKVADLIKEIRFCKDVGVLEKTYKYIAQSDPDVKDAYDKQFKKLSHE